MLPSFCSSPSMSFSNFWTDTKIFSLVFLYLYLHDGTLVCFRVNCIPKAKKEAVVRDRGVGVGGRAVQESYAGTRTCRGRWIFLMCVYRFSFRICTDFKSTIIARGRIVQIH